MFRFKFMKKWIRSRTSPIPLDRAEVWEKRFSLLYFICAWNLLAYAGYRYYKRDELGIVINKEETLSERLIRLSQTQNATIYRVNNLSLESRKDMDGVLLAEKKQLQELEASHA